jgi:pyruvate formate lyase activating enzyme
MAEAEARFWSRTEDGRIRCDLCPRVCKLRDGQRGFCYVRVRRGDRLILDTYGRSSGFCVDPIEKKPLNHFLPGTPVLSFGTAGCNLACRFCQNWDISKARADDVLADEATPEAITDTAAELGCRSVAFTYNDPVVFHEYAVDVAEACRATAIRTVAVTAGFVSAVPREEFYRHIDAANIDLKAFDDDFYRRVCGARLGPVLETLEHVHAAGVWLEITTLLIPELNDSDAEIDALTAWVVERLGPDVPLHFTAFHPDFKMVDRPSTPPGTLRRARRIAAANGVRHAYTGNVFDPEGQSTTCHACRTTVIGRRGYRLTSWRLDDTGVCAGCGTPCPGVFEPAPGTWGSRRLPVRIS